MQTISPFWIKPTSLQAMTLFRQLVIQANSFLYEFDTRLRPASCSKQLRTLKVGVRAQAKADISNTEC